ncbi:MAG: prepilin-type N-terminal cleavage/methylation domain-containing protein [Kiritimatiellae bacterium]|nr:prepilin-type N-terminal cleavage/methylation domain-containing protein [Kiritimatiellia bacterium]MDD5522260.1 prepilin-type N-terminal cleavage/methylation domain-containing protein [Kiritimatiellia bacterium]
MRKGFTLLELLTVMAIMAIVSSIAIMGYFAAVRGSGTRSAIEHMTQMISLARQTAIMQGKKVIVVFGQDRTNGWYSLCRAEGAITSVSSGYITDEYADWSDLETVTNMAIYNLTNCEENRDPKEGIVTYVSSTLDANGDVVWHMQVEPQNLFSSDGQLYGWPLYQRTTLARGLQLEDSYLTVPAPITFLPTGQAREERTIRIYEKINVGGTPVATIRVRRETGFVESE